MSGIFIEPNEEIEINIFVAISEKGEVFSDTDLKLVEEDFEGNKEDIVTYTVKFRKPDYKAEVEIYSDILKSNQDGESNTESPLSLDLAGVTYKRFVTLIKSWTFKDDEGKAIPPTQENIDKLHPSIARAITSELADHV